jgi:hypothetical protein
MEATGAIEFITSYKTASVVSGCKSPTYKDVLDECSKEEDSAGAATEVMMEGMVAENLSNRAYN